MTGRYKETTEQIEGTEVIFIEKPDGSWSVAFEGAGERIYVIGESKCQLREFARRTLREGSMPLRTLR